MKGLQRLLCLLLLAAPAAARAQYTFTPNADGVTCTIRGYSGTDGMMIIPTNIDGLTVVSIGASAFAGTNVAVPGTGLILVEPNDVPINVVIPSTVTNIGNGAFAICYNLASVTMGGSGTSIGDYAFANCPSLTSVAMATGVTTIGAHALANCNRLASLILPDSVTSIGDQAFGSGGLTSITIPRSVTNLSLDAFFFCFGLPAITVDPRNSFYSSTNGLLFDKGQTTVLLCPSGFAGSCALPAGIAAIGNSAFNSCVYLTSVTMPPGVNSIADQAFENCYDLTNVTLPEGVASIGYATFADCTSLPNITIPDTVATLGLQAFAACGKLTGVYFAGNAPGTNVAVFMSDPATAYYLPGTTGWGPTYDGISTAPWLLPYPVILSQGPGFGAQSNGFGFTISWATNQPVVVQACTNLASPVWLPVATKSLAGGTSQFNDPQWTNYSARFYRLSRP